MRSLGHKIFDIGGSHLKIVQIPESEKILQFYTLGPLLFSGMFIPLSFIVLLIQHQLKAT